MDRGPSNRAPEFVTGTIRRQGQRAIPDAFPETAFPEMARRFLQPDFLGV